jgi:RimJ/RimL family protein N-acetyltransferase
MNGDPEVMRHFPALMDHQQSAASMTRLRKQIEERGWGLWVVEVEGRFAGFTGLAVPAFEAPFMPCVEIGWRFRTEFWGRSIAYRAAQEALNYGFGMLKLPQIVSFTATTNDRSRRLMERLGLMHEPANDFEHPAFPEGHPLRRHVFYRLGRHDFIGQAA